MIVLAIAATLGAVVLSGFIALANGMSDSPSTPFQGKWALIGVWGLVAVLWLSWWVG